MALSYALSNWALVMLWRLTSTTCCSLAVDRIKSKLLLLKIYLRSKALAYGLRLKMTFLCWRCVVVTSYLAHYYRPADGPDMRGLGVFDAWTIHKGAKEPRCTGDIAIDWNGNTLVGFENHGGRTYLGTAKPLGKVLKGHGNNAEDHSEGAVYRNSFGTYMHGSLLPKNPHFADHLIALALARTYGRGDGTPESLVHLVASKNGSILSYNGIKAEKRFSKKRHHIQSTVKDEPFTFLTPIG